MMCLRCGQEAGRCSHRHPFPPAQLAPNHISQLQELLRESDGELLRAGVARFYALLVDRLERWEARQEALALGLSQDPELARRVRGLFAEFSWLEQNLRQLLHDAEAGENLTSELEHFFLDCCQDLAHAFEGAEALAARPPLPGQLIDWRAA